MHLVELRRMIINLKMMLTEFFRGAGVLNQIFSWFDNGHIPWQLSWWWCCWMTYLGNDPFGWVKMIHWPFPHQSSPVKKDLLYSKPLQCCKNSNCISTAPRLVVYSNALLGNDGTYIAWSMTPSWFGRRQFKNSVFLHKFCPKKHWRVWRVGSFVFTMVAGALFNLRIAAAENDLPWDFEMCLSILWNVFV